MLTPYERSTVYIVSPKLQAVPMRIDHEIQMPITEYCIYPTAKSQSVPDENYSRSVTLVLRDSSPNGGMFYSGIFLLTLYLAYFCES